MAVLQFQRDRFSHHQDLYQFLIRCKQSVSVRNPRCVASISRAIDAVDLLAVLEAVVKPHQRHFYFEKSAQEESVLAFESALQFESDGANRFADAKHFVQSTLNRSEQTGDLDAAFSGIHFFCNFSFFDCTVSDATFPAATVFLPRWQVSRTTTRSTGASQISKGVFVANFVVDQEFDPKGAIDEFQQMLQKIQSIKYEVIQLAVNPTQPFFKQQFVSQPNHYQKSVASALKLIQSKRFNKIVLADALDVVSPLPFKIVQSLKNLRSRYSNCYVFSSSNGSATFIGASPERLVSIHNQRLLTEALAGSAPRGKTRAEDARLAATLLNSDKEKHEHQVVIDSIAQHLKNLGLTPQFSPPRLLQLPNIQHLQTPIRATVTPSVHLLDAVAELHPTPAVAGAPRGFACAEIRTFEPFERSLYAAPIGWIDPNGNGEFAVGIRSAILQGNRARLFAGAGIVAGSNPDREFAEVHLKLQALLTALA